MHKGEVPNESYFSTGLLTAQSPSTVQAFLSLCLSGARSRDQAVLMNFISSAETKQHICLILHGFGYLDLIDTYFPGLGCDNCVLLPEVAGITAIEPDWGLMWFSSRVMEGERRSIL